MFELLLKTDSSILRFFTKISHWFQRLTGLTNYFLAAICTIFVSLNLLMAIIAYWFSIFYRGRTDIVVVIMSVIQLIFWHYLYRQLMRADKSVISGQETIELEPRFDDDVSVFMRIIISFIICILILLSLISPVAQMNPWEAATFYCSMVCIFCFFYFAAVIPLPPGKSKIKEWATSISAFFARMLPATSAGK